MDQKALAILAKYKCSCAKHDKCRAVRGRASVRSLWQTSERLVWNWAI